MNFFVTYDIETVENLKNSTTKNTTIHAHHSLLSIGLSNNLDRRYDRCFVRKDSTHEAAQEMVKAFVDELDIQFKLHAEMIPEYFKECEKVLQQKIEEAPKKPMKDKYRSYLNKLQSYTVMAVFGFNSSKYDMTVLCPYLFTEFHARGLSVNVVKKESSYFSVAVNEKGGRDERRRLKRGKVLYIFKDARLFTSPCSLSGYLKQNGVTETKSVFPYSLFHSVEELRAQTTFPEYELFFSELKQENVPREDYEAARNEYNRRFIII